MLYPVSRPAVASWNGRVFVFGGFVADGSPAQFIQCLDVAAERWTEVRPGIPGGSRTTCEFAVAIGDILYVACGTAPAIIDEHPMVGHRVGERSINTIRTFHPVLCRWTTVYQFSEPRTGSFSIAALNEHLYITGGQHGGLPCYAIDCFDPRTGRVETIGNASDGAGTLGLCTTLRVMHENFGL
jgi:Kelch motif